MTMHTAQVSKPATGFITNQVSPELIALKCAQNIPLELELNFRGNLTTKKKVKVTSFTHEDGSGKTFNFEGFTTDEFKVKGFISRKKGNVTLHKK